MPTKPWDLPFAQRPRDGMLKLEVNPFSDEYVINQINWWGGPGSLDEGRIRLTRRALKWRCDDYLNKNFRDGNVTAPIFMIDGTIWMSLTPMEVQSQFLAIRKAIGRVALMGLGMGFAALKMAASEDVDEIVVYEQDADVAEFFWKYFGERTGVREKIRVVIGDARVTCQGEEFDFAYCDVYQTMLPDEVISDIDLFCSANGIGYYTFWGFERVLLDALHHEIIDVSLLEHDERLYLMEWQAAEETFGDQRVLLSDLYQPLCEPDYAEEVMRRLVTMRPEL